jgi:trigger factor
MNISFENPDKINGLLTITVEESDYKDNVEKTLKDYQKKANVPGFRPGMVPMGLIKRQFGTSVKMEAVNKFIGEQIYKYVQDNKNSNVGRPIAI